MGIFRTSGWFRMPVQAMPRVIRPTKWQVPRQASPGLAAAAPASRRLMEAEMTGVGWLHTKSFQRATRCHSRLRSSLALDTRRLCRGPYARRDGHPATGRPEHGAHGSTEFWTGLVHWPATRPDRTPPMDSGLCPAPCLDHDFAFALTSTMNRTVTLSTAHRCAVRCR